MARIDAAYRALFSRPEVAIELICGLLDPGGTRGIKPRGLRLLSADWVTSSGARREADLVWYFEWDGQPVVLLLEFQATCDRDMVLRLAEYLALLARQVLGRQKELAGRKPQFLVVVVYNGDEPWRAPQSLASLLGPALAGGVDAGFALRYLLLAMRRADVRRWGRRSWLGFAIRLEQAKGVEEYLRVVRELSEALRQRKAAEGLRQAFRQFIAGAILPSVLSAEEIEAMADVEQLGAEARTVMDRWLDQARAEGRQQGLQEGLAEGHQRGLREGTLQGQRSLVLMLVEQKFGPLAEELRERIEQADQTQLLTWAQKILTAQSLAELFEELPEPPG